jgi:Kef-type K+ transport system membrane component KefB
MLLAGMVLIVLLQKHGIAAEEKALFIVFGLSLFLSFVFGRILSDFGIPSITSYLLMGLVLGPYVLDIFTLEIITEIKFVDNVALSLIALVAGGEITFKSDRIDLRKVTVFVVLQIVITFALVMVLMYLFGIVFNNALFMNMTAVIFIAVIANAKSPSTTVAVIIETEAKGRMTDYTLTSAILKDVFIIVLFTVVLSIFSSDGNVSVMGVVIEEVASVAMGIVLGVIVIFYIKHIKQNQGVFILLFTVIMTWVAKSIHLNPLLVFLFVGMTVNNFSKFGHSLVQNIEDNSRIIYLIFFFVAGTMINIPALKFMWPVALVIVFVRTSSIFVGCYFSAKAIKETPIIQKYSFLGFIGQAGVSIGFAGIIGTTFPGWGAEFQTLILAVVAMNQIIGPLGFKWALKKAGETNI